MNKHFVFISLLFLIACGNKKNEPSNKENTNALQHEQQDDKLLKQAQSIFAAIPASVENPDNPLTSEKIALGKILYFDTRLSLTGKNSCNSCHSLSAFGVDNEVTSIGDAGKRGGRNSPTTFNAALHFSQFWDGRAKDVEEQAGLPILNPIEMAIPSKEFLVKRLKGIEMYRHKFKSAFPEEKDALNYENISRAIGAFERTLLTPARFDKYLQGQKDALSDDEKNGLQIFMDKGCITCHNGVALGGGQIQKFGLRNEYHSLTGSNNNDNGLMDLTNKESDKDKFKLPSLRNISKTYPYFHDGSVKELDKAIAIMGHTQLDVKLTDQEINSIASFLETLTSDIPEEVKQVPQELVNKSL